MNSFPGNETDGAVAELPSVEATKPTQTVILLGPQSRVSTLAPTLAQLGIEGRIATVTAGWQEREDEIQDLQAHLDGRSENLQLYRRTESVFLRDPELAAIHRERQAMLQKMQRLYDLRMRHAMQAEVDLERRADGSELVDEERDRAMEAVRRLDAEHLARIREVHDEYDDRLRLEERPVMQRHRREIRRILDSCAALAIAGGHVAALFNRLRLFSVVEFAGDRPVVGWSAGAMVLSERIVTYHDRPPQGPGFPEVIEAGFSLVRGVVPLPHARKRLLLDDPSRVSRFARRFAPGHCLAMDEGATLVVTPEGWSASPETRRLQPEGGVEEFSNS